MSNISLAQRSTSSGTLAGWKNNIVVEPHQHAVIGQQIERTLAKMARAWSMYGTPVNAQASHARIAVLERQHAPVVLRIDPSEVRALQRRTARRLASPWGTASDSASKIRS